MLCSHLCCKYIEKKRQLLQLFALEALNSISSQECYVLLGDFNAHVGSRVEDDEWWDERGPNGLGALNDAGRELLSFLSVNGAAVCNAWFQKKAIHKQTWQHPKSKQWHCIDYAIVMRKSQSWRCLDIVVKIGVVCNTDHRMLLVKMKIGKKFTRRGSRDRLVKRFDVAGLQGACMDVDGIESCFVSYVCDNMKKKKWNVAGTAQEKLGKC